MRNIYNTILDIIDAILALIDLLGELFD